MSERTSIDAAAELPLWQDGWLRGAQRLDSPNFGARPTSACIDLILVHSISLPPGCFTGDAVLQLFRNELDWGAHPYFEQIRGLTVSAHFFLRRNGELWQCVSCDQRAWHAGASCWRGRGNCNDDSIGIELEGLEDRQFEPMQYQTLEILCRQIAERYPVQHIAGHEHVAPGRKCDPGSGFDWTRLRNDTGWPAEWFPPSVT